MRKRRTAERRLLKLAKQRFRRMYGEEVPLNRSVIRRLKVTIKKEKTIGKKL